MIILDRFYFGEDVNKKYKFNYDRKNNKRPSWVLIYKAPKNLNFIRISIDNETFWYRKYFENYFFPLDATKEDHEIYYDRIAKEYDKLVPQNKEIANFILKQLIDFKIQNYAPILEIGAGTGLISEKIAKSDYNNLTLLDISGKALKIAKDKKVLTHCKFIKSDILQFKSKKKFNVIYSSMALDYFNEEELDNIINIIKKHLIKNGFFICVDRHISKQYGDSFKKIKQGYFFLDTSVGKWRYDYFIGKL